VAEAGLSLRETGLVAATSWSRTIELCQLRDAYGFAPDSPASATRSGLTTPS